VKTILILVGVLALVLAIGCTTAALTKAQEKTEKAATALDKAAQGVAAVGQAIPEAAPLTTPIVAVLGGLSVLLTGVGGILGTIAALKARAANEATATVAQKAAIVTGLIQSIDAGKTAITDPAVLACFKMKLAKAQEASGIRPAVEYERAVAPERAGSTATA